MMQDKEPGFPKQFSTTIRYQGFELGNIKLSFEENKSLSEANRKKYSQSILTIYDELEMALDETKNDMELLIREGSIFRKLDALENIALNRLLGKFVHLYISPPTANKFHFDLLLTDENVFNLIEKFGPRALRNRSVQIKISDWLSDKEIISEKVNKLRDSLKSFSVGPNYDDETFVRRQIIRTHALIS